MSPPRDSVKVNPFSMHNAPSVVCCHGFGWFPNLYEPGGYNCAAGECFVDPYGDLYFRDDFDDDFADGKDFRYKALDAWRDREQRREKFWNNAGNAQIKHHYTFGKGEKVSVPGSYDRSSDMQLVVSRAERAKKYDKKSFLSKIFSKKPKYELPEKPESSVGRETAALSYRTKTPSSRHELSRHESSRREPSRYETAPPSYKLKVETSTRPEGSKYESSSRHDPSNYKDTQPFFKLKDGTTTRQPPSNYETSSRREPSRQESSSRREPIRHESSSSRREPSRRESSSSSARRKPSRHESSSSKSKPSSQSSSPLKHSTFQKPPSTNTRKPSLLSTLLSKPSTRHPPTTSTQTPPTLLTKAVTAVKTAAYRLGDMERTFVEGQASPTAPQTQMYKLGDMNRTYVEGRGEGSEGTTRAGTTKPPGKTEGYKLGDMQRTYVEGVAKATKGGK